MSSNETHLIPAEVNGGPTAVRTGGEPAMSVWAAPPAETHAVGIAPYLHAFRRHWFLCTALGLMAAAVAGVATWFGYGYRYEAAAFLRVSMRQEQILPNTRAYVDLINEYEVFKNTQQQLVRSRFVLNNALKNPEVKSLQLEKRERDPVGWLAEELIVRYPGRAEIMEVAMRSRNGKEASILVQAVVDAYLQDIVNVESRQRRERLNDLDRVFNEKEGEVRQVRTALKALAEDLGTSDRETITLKQQIAMQQYAEYQRQLMQAQFELRRTKGELDAQVALLEAVNDQDISDYEIDSLARNDPVARDLQTELAWRRMDMAYIDSHTAENQKARYASKYKTDFESLRSQLAEVYDSIREGLKAMRRSEINKEIQKLEAQFAGLVEFEKRLANEVDVKRQEAERLSTSSIDLEMMRNQITQLENTLKQVHEERERLRVEQRAAPRVTPLQGAEEPKDEYMPSIRYLLVTLASLAAFCLPVGLVIWGDSRGRKINSVEEVAQQLAGRAPLMGALPIVPGRVLRRLGGPAAKQSAWAERLTAAVDSVAARVMRVATSDNVRVVLTTSAVGGEGSTTTATQLAASLARNGRRTVLIDGNFRRPVLHRLFGVEDAPGVCEWLRGEASLGEIARQTEADGLTVISAGRLDRQSLAALAKGSIGELFAQLRNDFEMIVIDGAAVLPVADTRLISQHVDMVILAVFRDVSQSPKVQSACEILDAFGARRLETVVMAPAGDR